MLVTSFLFPRDYSGYALDCSMSNVWNARNIGVVYYSCVFRGMACVSRGEGFEIRVIY